MDFLTTTSTPVLEPLAGSFIGADRNYMIEKFEFRRALIQGKS
jgi:hypothetical protein